MSAAVQALCGAAATPHCASSVPAGPAPSWRACQAVAARVARVSGAQVMSAGGGRLDAVLSLSQHAAPGPPWPPTATCRPSGMPRSGGWTRTAAASCGNTAFAPAAGAAPSPQVRRPTRHASSAAYATPTGVALVQRLGDASWCLRRPRCPWAGGCRHVHQLPPVRQPALSAGLSGSSNPNGPGGPAQPLVVAAA